MAINVNPPNLSGLASRGGAIGNLASPGALGLQSLQLGLSNEQAKRQAALQAMKIRQQDELMLRQQAMERQRLAQQAAQFQAEQAYRRGQLQQGLLGQQLQQRGQDMQYNMGMAELGANKQAAERQAYAKMYEQELKRLAEKKEEELANMGAFSVQAKLALEQTNTAAEANMLRNEIVDEAVQNGFVPKEQAKTLKQLSLSGFKNFINHSMALTDSASKYKAMKKADEKGGPDIEFYEDGTVKSIKQKPTAPVQTQLQKDVLDRDQALQELAPLRDKFDKEYFGVKGRTDLAMSKLADDWSEVPLANTVLSRAANAWTGKNKKEREQFIQDATGYLNSIERFFQQRYRKPITGAQAAIAELKDLRKSFLSGNMSPNEFKGALDSILQNYVGESEYKKNVLQQGVDVSPSKTFVYNPETGMLE